MKVVTINIKRVISIFLFLMEIIPSTYAQGVEAPYIEISKFENNFKYEVNGKKVMGESHKLLPLQPLEEAIAKSLINGGKGQTAAIVISNEISFDIVSNMTQKLKKIGFENIRIFLKNKKGTFVQEINYGDYYLISPSKISQLNLKRINSD